MIVAVLDTNTIVSATLEARGIPSRIVQSARAGEYVWVSSPTIIAEVVATLRRRRIRDKYHVTDADVERVRSLLEHETVSAPRAVQAPRVATHPEDDLILAAAAAARAEYLVTGDRQLQKLGTYEGAKIVSPREFWEVLLQQYPS